MESDMDKYILIGLVVLAVAFFFFKSGGNSEEAEANRKAGAEFLAQNKLKDGIKETASGLQYEVIQKGEGTSKPIAKSKVKVHYHGTLLDGTVFDSSVDRGAPLSFRLNQVIPGWTEGVQLMVEGDKFRFYISSDLAYGNRSTGKIGAGSTLIFEVELLAIGQ